MDDLKYIFGNIIKVADGVWLLAGNQKQVERFRAILADVNEETPWSKRLAIMDYPFPIEDISDTEDNLCMT